ITPALILGAVAERMKFGAWVAFITIWFLVVYCPIAHMVWSAEGWIFKASAIDFAGGLVVHMSSGFSALVAALLLGKRYGLGKDPMPPHSLPLCLVGAGLLWTGWFGFNAGSALSASPLATLAFLNTSTAASAGGGGGGPLRVGPRGKAEGARRRHGGRRGPGGDHPCLRQRRSHGRHLGRHRRGDHLVRRVHVPQAGVRVRRFARRVRRARPGRRLGRPRLRHLRRHAGLRHREQRPADHGAAE